SEPIDGLAKFAVKPHRRGGGSLPHRVVWTHLTILATNGRGHAIPRCWEMGRHWGLCRRAFGGRPPRAGPLPHPAHHPLDPPAAFQTGRPGAAERARLERVLRRVVVGVEDLQFGDRRKREARLPQPRVPDVRGARELRLAAGPGASRRASRLAPPPGPAGL